MIKTQEKDPIIEAKNAAREFAIQAAELASQTRCHNVVVLDVSDISPVTDFFVITSGINPRQMRAVAKDIEELARERDWCAMSRAGLETPTWVLLDFVDVVIHVFSDDARLYYDLDNLWGDAKKVKWKE